MDYMNSKTYENIIGAYRGEISGVILYQMLCEEFEKRENMEVAALFKKLSSEEQGHANVLAKHIKEDLKNLELSSEEIENLKKALTDPIKSMEMFSAGEIKAGEVGYPAYAEIAKNEGYDDIAKMFLTLAKVEISHGKLLASQLEKLK